MTRQRPVLVLLHGFALHAGVWGDWLNDLANLVEPRAIDLPGHGTRAWDPRIGDLAGLARAVSQEVPVGAIVLGWSLGGMIALELARQRPTSLEGLVLIATTPRFVAGADWAHGIDSTVLEAFERGVRADYHRTVQDFLALQVLGAADSRSTLRALRAAVHSRPAPDQRALETGLDILQRTDLRDALANIASAALVITGQRDRLTPPAAAEFLSATLPYADLRHIAGAGHAPFLSHPESVRRELARFLRQRAEARPASADA